jgi:hypothetical protein
MAQQTDATIQDQCEKCDRAAEGTWTVATANDGPQDTTLCSHHRDQWAGFVIGRAEN